MSQNGFIFPKVGVKTQNNCHHNLEKEFHHFLNGGTLSEQMFAKMIQLHGQKEPAQPECLSPLFRWTNEGFQQWFFGWVVVEPTHLNDIFVKLPQAVGMNMKF